MWEGKSPTHISIVEVSEPGQLQKGDSIVTVAGSISAKLGSFPPNIMVGILEDFGKDQGSNYYRLDVKLSTNFNALKYVYVVNEIMREERETIENEVINADN